MRLMLATDNLPLRALVKRSLARFPYDWEDISDGFDAFEKAITRKFDLIILDFDLPRMKASEILMRFRSLENFHQPPRNPAQPQLLFANSY
jgi:DNA-binding response OmpR family regulator